MVKLQLLSPNLVMMLQEVLKDEEIVKYLNYNDKTPLSKPSPTLPANDLMLNKVFPFPFDVNVTTEEGSQVRIYFPKGFFKSKEIVTDTVVVFDIVVAKSLWLVNDGDPKIRPYEIMKNIVNLFSDKNIGTIGRLNFDNFTHLLINEKFSGIRLYAEMTTFNTGD